MFLKVILKSLFVMILVSIRMRTKCLTFANVSIESVGVKRFFSCEQARNYEHPTYSRGLCSFPPPLDVSILPLIDKEPHRWM